MTESPAPNPSDSVVAARPFRPEILAPAGDIVLTKTAPNGVTLFSVRHDNIDSSAQWDAQGFQSFGVGLRGVMAVDGLD